MPRFTLILFLGLLLSFSGKQALAQSAAITGLVVDPSNAAIPNVRIALTNQKTQTVVRGTTNSTGTYSLPFVQPGVYSLAIDAPGFRHYEKTSINVSVAQNLELDAKLDLGGTAESVTVSGSGIEVNTTDASVSTVIDHQFIENIPLNGRSLQSLITVVPGVSIVPSSSGITGEYTVNGQRTEENYFTVDGVSSNSGSGGGNPGAGGGYFGSLPSLTILGTTQSVVSLDALQEFRAITSTFSAEYGSAPGGQFSFLTRSGTNDWHGSAFDYFRNEALDANNWFNNRLGTPRQPERQNDFGGTLGGPIRIPGVYNGKNKTFFFFSYEGLRLSRPVAAQQYTVPSLSVRQAAPAALQAFVNGYPLPNGIDTGNGMAYFKGAYSAPQSLNSTSIRVDHNFNNHWNVFGRYSYVPSTSLTRSGGDLAQANTNRGNVKSWTFGSTNTFSSNASNELRFNYTDNTSAGDPARFDDFGGATPLSLSGDPVLSDPYASSFTHMACYDVGCWFMQGGAGRAAQQQINVVDSFSKLVGRHSLKAGINYRHMANQTGYLSSSGANLGQFAFYTSLQEVLDNTSDFNSLSKSTFIPKPHYAIFAAYVQDEWKASSRLNLSLGVRWDVAPPPKDSDGNTPYTVTTTDPATMRLAPKDAPLWKTRYGNFAPRFGAAYQLHQQPGRETVLRAGVGLFYDTSLATATDGYTFGIGSSWEDSIAGGAFPATQAQFDAITAPNLNPPYDSNIYGSDPNLKLPYSLQWNAAIEQSLGPNQTFLLNYVASTGHALQTRRSYTPSALGNTYFEPGVFVMLTENRSSSNYQSLQVQFNRRVSHGINVSLASTWAHSLDDTTTNLFLTDLLRASSDYDIRFNFQGAITYDLPGRFQNRMLSTVASGWSIDTRLTARTALPVDVTTATALSPQGITVAFHPDRIPDVPLYLNDPSAPGGRVINCEAFLKDCALANAPVGEGNAGRNPARGFSAVQDDLAIRKEFRLADQLQLQFRAEAFNIFNHPILGSINNTLQDGKANGAEVIGFGVATNTLNSSLGGLNSLYQVGGPRSLQLALKLHF